MPEEDSRWVHRYDNYKKALTVLERTVSLAEERPLSEVEQQGLIKGFEFTYELAWNVLKDYLEGQGFNDFHGSKDTTRIAFQEGLLDNGEAWMEMISSRNASSHTYNEDTAAEITEAILKTYIYEFRKLFSTMARYLK
jgi:nucleotidyltransferase substrate binding protein (TIGR01987 family)